MGIQDLVKALQEKGLTDEQIKEELLKMKADIDAFLGEAPAEEKPAEEPAAPAEEDEDAKMKEVFGV